MKPKEIAFNIWTNLRDFFINDVINKTPKRGTGEDTKGMIVLLDDWTTKILNSIMGLVDFSDGMITGLLPFNGSQARNQMIGVHVLYFISPSDESLELLNRDFDMELKEK